MAKLTRFEAFRKCSTRVTFLKRLDVPAPYVRGRRLNVQQFSSRLKVGKYRKVNYTKKEVLEPFGGEEWK